jgi:arginyl-tRNA synthetase
VLPAETQLDLNVTECSNQKLGDYQCNSAMSIFAELKKKGDTRFSNPRSLAEAIVAALPEDESLFASTSVAGRVGTFHRAILQSKHGSIDDSRRCGPGDLSSDTRE